MPQPLTVSDVAKLVRKRLVECNELRNVLVRGEISQYTAKGHHYFTLKDEKSVLKCVVWENQVQTACGSHEFTIGMKVIAKGSVTTYPAQSTYQLEVYEIQPEGQGELYKKYLELKEKLEKEGLFAPEHKSPIPLWPEKLGIVTSTTGKAIDDILKILKMGTGLNVLLVDTQVQGEGAPESLIRGLKRLDGKVDIIIIGRGGGSIEDLWAFNDEALARTVYSCKTPIISAVGHETDSVITDFVADLRMPTPTAAANHIVDSMRQVLDKYNTAVTEMDDIMNEYLNNARQKLETTGIEHQDKIILQRLRILVGELGNADNAIAMSVVSKLHCAKDSYSKADFKFRTSWVAVLKERGFASMYQNGVRVKDAAAFRKGSFDALLRDGKVTGDVKDVEIRKNS